MAERLTPEDIESARQKVRDHFGSDVDPLPLAAIGITVQVWRRTDELEDAHTIRFPAKDRITDGEMFAANAATTRFILARIQPSYSAVDWLTLADDVTDPARFAGRRTVSHLLGSTRQKKWAARARRTIDYQAIIVKEYGPEICWLHAHFGSTHIWWGHPDWPALVATFIDGLRGEPPHASAAELHSGLLDSPDTMDPEILDWCTSQLIGYTLMRRD
jgi:hypothetical protein